MKNKPGTVLKAHWASKGWKPTTGGCKCNNLASKMDSLGCDGCQTHIQQLAIAIRASAKNWKDNQGKLIWQLIPLPPVVYFKRQVQWAIDKARHG